MITFLLAKNYEVELLANVSETKRLHLYAKAQFFSIFYISFLYENQKLIQAILVNSYLVL